MIKYKTATYIRTISDNYLQEFAQNLSNICSWVQKNYRLQNMAVSCQKSDITDN